MWRKAGSYLIGSHRGELASNGHFHVAVADDLLNGLASQLWSVVFIGEVCQHNVLESASRAMLRVARIDGLRDARDWRMRCLSPMGRGLKKHLFIVIGLENQEVDLPDFFSNQPRKVPNRSGLQQRRSRLTR